MKFQLFYYLVFLAENGVALCQMAKKELAKRRFSPAGKRLLVAGLAIGFLGFILPNISSGGKPSVLLTGYSYLPEAGSLVLETDEDPVVLENPKLALSESAVAETHHVIVTAYSSTPDQTDDTPFITATGNRVRDGIIAANFLSFGTRVMFPDYSGRKVYVVDDRMNRRFPYRADIWMETREEARKFGIKLLKMEVLR